MPLDPRRPTSAPPGSEEKIQILILRAAARISLFHPLDGGNLEEPPPYKHGRAGGMARHGKGDLPRGVSWQTRKRAYRARVTLDGERFFLGLFPTVTLAEEAIRNAIRQHRASAVRSKKKIKQV